MARASLDFLKNEKSQPPTLEALTRPPENSKVLDGQVVEFDGLKIAGISGIVGNPKRPGRRHESDFLNVLDKLLKQEPHLVVLHESPKGNRPDQFGNPQIAELL